MKDLEMKTALIMIKAEIDYHLAKENGYFLDSKFVNDVVLEFARRFDITQLRSELENETKIYLILNGINADCSVETIIDGRNKLGVKLYQSMVNKDAKTTDKLLKEMAKLDATIVRMGGRV